MFFKRSPGGRACSRIGVLVVVMDVCLILLPPDGVKSCTVLMTSASQTGIWVGSIYSEEWTIAIHAWTSTTDIRQDMPEIQLHLA